MLVDFETSKTRYSLFQEGRGKVICCLVWGQLSLLIIKFDDKLGKKKKMEKMKQYFRSLWHPPQ